MNGLALGNMTATTSPPKTPTNIDPFPRTRTFLPSLVDWNPKNEYVMTAPRNVDIPHTRKANGRLRIIAKLSILALLRKLWKK